MHGGEEETYEVMDAERKARSKKRARKAKKL
jgi:hypothetical protein